MGVPPTGGVNGKDGPSGFGYLCSPPPEHSHTVHFNQAHYGPVSGGRATPRDKGVKEAVVAVVSGTGGDADGGSVSGTGGELVCGCWGRYGYGVLGWRILYQS